MPKKSISISLFLLVLSVILTSRPAFSTSCKSIFMAFGKNFEMLISPDVMSQILRDYRRGIVGESSAYQTYRPMLNEVSQDQAKNGAQVIKDVLRQAGQFVQQGKLEEAGSLLDNNQILDHTGFHFQNSSVREVMDVDSIPGSTEQEFSNFAVRQLKMPPNLGLDGTVVIPARPTGKSESQKSEWSKKKWIRTAAEELGHVAQILQEHSGITPLLSSTMNRNPHLNKGIQHEGMAINERGLKHGHSFVDWNYETDIYAYLIETFGPEFIPSWMGQDSGYFLRERVDLHFTNSGMNDRYWKKNHTK